MIKALKWIWTGEGQEEVLAKYPVVVDYWELERQKFEKILRILIKKDAIQSTTITYLYPQDYFIFKTHGERFGIKVSQDLMLMVGNFTGIKSLRVLPLLGMLEGHYAVYENGELVAGGDFDEKFD